jgi:DNA-binding transcriptional regulator YdaS (Cro superfamily)
MAQTPLERAVEAAKSQSAYADAVGTSQQRISYLLKHKKPMPAEFVLKTESAFGIPRHESRPDIYPAPAPAAAEAA